MAVFDNFTNLYSLSKTLRFGLIPLRWDKDQKKIIEDRNFTLLKEKEIIQKDIRTAENIKAAKFYLDILHRELIDQTLNKLKFEKSRLEEYAHLLEEKEKNSKNKEISKDVKKKIFGELKKKLKIAEDNLLVELGEAFAIQSQKLFTKDSTNDIKKGENILLSKHALEALKRRFTQKEIDRLSEENKEKGIEYPNVTYLNTGGTVQSVFDMDAGYLDEFHKNRELLYSIKGKKGSLSRRILDNFKIFCNNKKIYVEKYKNSDPNFSEAEKNFNVKFTDVFDFDYYNNCLSQKGIDEYVKILGGVSHKQKRTSNIHGLNQIINLYMQQKESEHKENQKQKGKKKIKFNKKEYPTFTRLQKQILSQIFHKEIFIESDHDLIRELKFFIGKGKEKVSKAQEVIEFFLDYKNNRIDLTKVYLPKSKINSFAYKVFKESTDFMMVFRDGNSNLDYVNFDKIKAHLENQELEYKDFLKTLVKEKQGFNALVFLLKHEINLLIVGGETVVKGGIKKEIASLDTKRKNLKEKLKWFEDKVRKNEKMKDEEEGEFCSAVLAYSEAVSEITRRAEIFWLNEKQNEKIGEDNKDLVFYKKFEELNNDDFVPFFYFDKFGNYLKKRSRNTEKEIKLHFDNDHLLDGWDMNKEPDYYGFLLRNGNEYYLGIGNKKGDIFHAKSGKSVKKVDEAYAVNGEDYYEKIEYKQLDISKFEGVAFGKGNDEKTAEELQKKKHELADEFLDRDIQKIEEYFLIKQDYDAFKKERQKDKAWDRRFPKEKMKKLIEYYIICLGKRDDWRRFNLQFKKPEEYENRDDFVKHIQRQAYWIDPQRVNKKYVDEKVANGEMFLFKIHNKDFYDFENKQKKEQAGEIRSNLFTQYFLELFSPENIKNIKSKDPYKSIFELDGKAEIRFRPKTDDVKLKIYQRQGKDVIYTDKRDGNKEKEVIQHRRFAKDALTLHLKIRLNFGKYLNLLDFNKLINTELLMKAPVKILGIDRGENNLIYYCILNELGDIEKSGSLNKVGERVKKLNDGRKLKEPVDYFQLLVDREKQRDWEQKNWQKMTPIKTLKESYLGNVVHWISEETFNSLDKGITTVNVLENLSGSFKKTRFFRERQVYQGFEKALISNFNYLVNKKRGNVKSAYQFTPIVDSIEEMEKNSQLGTIIYVPASYTSKICPKPKCGWRKRLYVKNSTSKETIINLLESKKINISYEEDKNRFRFEYQWEQEYDNNGKKEKYNGLDKVFSNVSRSKWNYEQIEKIAFINGTPNSITNGLKELFKKESIDLKNINQQLVDRQKKLGVEFYQSIIFYFNLIMQIRNYDLKEKGNEVDYIECPSCLFDSRKAEINGKLSSITNGDANGAYNIARKGVMLLKKIRKHSKDDPEFKKAPDLFISNQEWDSAVSD